MSSSSSTTRDRRPAPARSVSRRRPRRRGGVVMALTLLAMILLAALVLWLINLGQQVDHRITTQNAADASVRAGSGWIARTMNMIAENNLAMARYIAAVDVLDAMPQASDFQMRETTAFQQGLSAQLQRGLGPGPAVLTANLSNMLGGMLTEMTREQNDMAPVAQFFKQIDVGQMTQYNRNGSLWRAMSALDEMNSALVDGAGLMAQTAAIRGAQVNMPAERQQGAIMLPLSPTIPAKRGNFAEFEYPVRLGILPPGEDDRVYNRGPYDAVFGWRDLVGQWSGGTWVPGNASVAGGGAGKHISVTRGASFGNNGQMVGQTYVPTNYVTYGPQGWLLRTISNYRYDHLPDTRFDWYAYNIAQAKLAFLWPDTLGATVPQGSVMQYYGLRYPNVVGSQMVAVWDPDWRTDFAQATSIASAGQPVIRETAYVIIEIKSKYPIDDPAFMTPGTWATVSENNLPSPRIVIEKGWDDPRRWGAKQVGNYVWQDLWNYQVYWDNTIGITKQMQTPDTGGQQLPPTQYLAGTTPQPVPQTVYRIDHAIFLGVNVGNGANVTNPFDGFNPGSPDAPAPMILDQNVAPRLNSPARWAALSQLALVSRGDTPQAWPSRFHGGRPSPNVVALAQAHVFNNHSWDLWTPMWRSQLQPVSHYDDWITDLDGTASTDAPVDAAEVQFARQYLTNARPLASMMLEH